MGKSTENYSHMLEIDEEKRVLIISRVFKDGTKQLFTYVNLPEKTYSDDESGFREFSKTLGENLLIDSPAARRLLGL
jgi:hypothetical protein